MSLIDWVITNKKTRIMLKKILNLTGVEKLTDKQKKNITAGAWRYSDATGNCVSPSATCGGIYPVKYPGSWCCEK